MRSPARSIGLSLALLMVAALPAAAQAADAEAQYRVARRLAAEGAASAGAALDRVVSLDPEGPWADDAMVDRATLIGLPRWPEDLGRLDLGRVEASRALLKRVADLPRADRAAEAAYRHGLLMLEPVAGNDPDGAYLALLTVASGKDEAWSSSARYALGWTFEKRGERARAEAAYQRVRVDFDGSEAAARATAAVGRLELQRKDHAKAAARFQQALDSGQLGDALAASAEALRTAAAGAMLGRIATAEGLRLTAATRPNAISSIGRHGALLAQRKGGAVVEIDATGAVVDRWTLDQPLDVAATANGSRYAATADALVKLHPGGTTTVVSGPGGLGAFSALEADDLGRVWALDRRGESLAVIEPGATNPRTVWSAKGARLSGLDWDGERLLSIDTRARSVLAIYPDGSSETLAAGVLDRPSAVAADPSGTLAVLEARGTSVSFLDPDGNRVQRFSVEGAGMQRAIDLSFGMDGTLQLVEESSGTFWRAR